MSVMSLEEMIASEERKARTFRTFCEDRRDQERLALATAADALLSDLKRRGEHLSKASEQGRASDAKLKASFDEPAYVEGCRLLTLPLDRLVTSCSG